MIAFTLFPSQCIDDAASTCLVKSRSVWIQEEGSFISWILSTHLSYTQSVSWFTTAQIEHILAPCQHCCDLYKNTSPQRITSGFVSVVCRVVNRAETKIFSCWKHGAKNLQIIHNVWLELMFLLKAMTTYRRCWAGWLMLGGRAGWGHRQYSLQTEHRIITAVPCRVFQVEEALVYQRGRSNLTNSVSCYGKFKTGCSSQKDFYSSWSSVC